MAETKIDNPEAQVEVAEKDQEQAKAPESKPKLTSNPTSESINRITNPLTFIACIVVNQSGCMFKTKYSIINIQKIWNKIAVWNFK